MEDTRMERPKKAFARKKPLLVIAPMRLTLVRTSIPESVEKEQEAVVRRNGSIASDPIDRALMGVIVINRV
ncbi:hypothetical protein Y032_0040g211 [Ancylostoma ceylanicum]|uniref:Uncharacterized protein n=1 Tax=Ancylostoma ceylanicum TaxID=53326 RepID=A0A016UHZ6_9BILA|nr:hypothetical protein Y032_0040g211 [Ancylostoma ceylanicum]